MKRIIKLTEADLTRIVKKVIMEQGKNVPYEGGRKTVSTMKDTLRSLFSSGSIDYNYLENKIPIDRLHFIIHGAITQLDPFGEGGDYDYHFGGFGDDEAVVESAFIRILKETNPKQALEKVKRLYRDEYGSDMMSDIRLDINIYEKYHDLPNKPSIADALDQIQKSGDGKPTPANDKICKYSWNGPDDKSFYNSKIIDKWGFESLLTFQKWCKNDAKKYYFRNSNNGITKDNCGNPDGKLGCCTVTCAKAVDFDKNLLNNILDHSERANRLY